VGARDTPECKQRRALAEGDAYVLDASDDTNGNPKGRVGAPFYRKYIAPVVVDMWKAACRNYPEETRKMHDALQGKNGKHWGIEGTGWSKVTVRLAE
jgi:hypothetical protein